MTTLTTTRHFTAREFYRGVQIPLWVREKWYAGSGNGLTVGQMFARGVDSTIESIRLDMAANGDGYAVQHIEMNYAEEMEV